MPFETNFGGVRTSVTDFQRVFTFTATGLKPSSYYDVLCEGKLTNHCAIQAPTDTNSYAKSFKRVKNIEIPSNIDLVASGLYNNGRYESRADIPLKTDTSGTLTFQFDGSVWIRDGGQGASTQTGTSTGGYLIPGTNIRIYGKGAFIAPVYTTSMTVTLRQSTYVGPLANTVPIPGIPIGPVTPPEGWSLTKPEQPANTYTEKILSSNTVTTSKDLGVLRTRKQFGDTPEGNVPLSEVSLYFDYAQTFYLDPAKFDGSQYVSLTGINLYFRSKPHRENNQSGIVAPGTYVFISEVENDIPNLSRAYRESIVRVGYDEINASLNALDFTSFPFRSPMPLKTGKSYAIVVNFEDPQFSLWTATQGVKLINSDTICDSAYNFGKLFRASNYLEIDNDPKTKDDVLKAIPATDLMFDITGLEFTDENGNLQSASIELVHEDYEFLEINNITCNIPELENIYDVFGNRQMIYQDFGNSSANVFYYKPGTLNVSSTRFSANYLPLIESIRHIVGFGGLNLAFPGSLIVQGNGTRFTRDLEFGSMIVITDGIPSNANGYIANTCIRKVRHLANDTLLILESPPTFTANAAYYKVTPVGFMESAFQNPDTLVLIDSNADEDLHFVANAVNYINFTGGSGYSNTDYIIFSGAGAKRNGRASITTNSTGGIVSLNIVNTGYGFTSSPVATVYNINNSLSSGAGATFNVTIGGQIKAELYGAKADITQVVSYPVNNFIPNLQFNIKGGTISNNNINFSFLTNNQYDLTDNNFVPIITGQSVDITTYDSIIMSKSLEVLNRTNLVRSTSEGKSSLIKFRLTADNKYDTPELHEELASIFAFNNEINNDANNEHTNFGNAIARHISKKITFDKDRYAEDIRVITTAYRPEGTDIKIFAKIHNSKDEEAFDDKNWTELEIKDASFGGRLYSSRANKKDYVELTYGFKQYPDFTTTLTGDAFVYSATGNTTVTGVGTSFNTQLANGDVIVIYDEEFPNTNYGVAVVANTPTATAFEINKAFSNLSLESATLKIGKADKPYMAFNDMMSDNVATYYSTGLNEFTTYDTFAVKVVMISNSSYVVPRLNDIRAIGVSS